MTRKEALTELLAKVEAGDGIGALSNGLCAFAFNADGVKGATYDAVNGSLDAAKALHEAVLPGWTMDQMNEWHAHGESAGWCVCLLRHSEPKMRARAGEFDMHPARSWLIAIIKARIAMENDT